MTRSKSEPIRTLHEARTELFERAKRRWYASAILGAAIILLSIVAATTDNGEVLSSLGIASLVLSLAAFLLRESAYKMTDSADKTRRRTLYADGLGREIEEENLLEISADVRRMGISAELEPYYASNTKVGPYRLNENVKESAYFTWMLAQSISTVLRLFSWLVILTALTVLYSAATSSSPTINDWLPTVAKVIVLVLAIIIGGDFNSISRSYSNLCDAAERAYRRCARLNRRSDLDAVEVLITSEDYSVALIQAPPIPTWLYHWRRDALNAAYQDATANELSSSS